MRPLPLLLSLLLPFAAPAAAVEDSRYEGNDAEKETRYRRLFTPWEFALLIDAHHQDLRSDPAVSGYGAEAQGRVRVARTAMLAALDGATPNYETAVRALGTIRSALMAPVSESYLAASASAAGGAGGPLSAFEAKIWDAMKTDWLPRADALALHGRTAAPQDVRAFLRSQAKAYKERPPTGRIDYRAVLTPVQNAIRGVLSADEATLTAVYAAAGMTRTSAAPADPRLTDPSDRAARLRMALPEPQYSALERSILAAVLTDEAFAQVVAGRFTGDLKKEALDAANLAMADQSSPEIQAAIRGKTIFRPGSLAGLRTSIPPADMSRYVCGAMDRQGAAARAPELVGAQGTARADLDASAAAADVIRVETTALPGIARYCQESASLRAPPPDTRPVQPQQRLRTDAPPGPATAGQNVTGRPVEGPGSTGGIGGMLGGLWEGAKANAPYMIGGAVGGLIVAAALGGGPLGLAAGLALGAGVGLLLGIFGGGKGGG
jgi:hypothetical protein